MFSQISDASKLVVSKLEGWLDKLIIMLPNLVIAILVVASFYLLSKLVDRILRQILHKLMQNESVVKLILSITSFLIVLIGLTVALGVLKLDKTVTSMLAGIGVLGLALGFAFQDAAANLISGVIMAVQSPINVGDIIESNDTFGAVKSIGLRATTIYDPQGQDVVIPNRLIFQNLYRHYTINGQRRIDLSCGISYGDDLDKVEKVSIEAIKKITSLQPGRDVEFFYKEFGDSSINFVIRYWVDFRRQPDYLKAQSEGIKNLKKAFDQNDITIPFPIRTLDFGIKGGEKLSQVLNKE
ncbi:mechanosensitive ion channel family protein [Fulvivirga sediminis]|uniref:Mechanosensitive ion channel n=1 Tax=Fulvivirga sediminis TaxID=2803949 RepID=A0A937F564_9BACT|nr:mechanosensitive ion channel family protein [Fulvivirga sediminis]MBL3655216.1 mechanosensitive ion channel [Fulvivirga sediminis]